MDGMRDGQMDKDVPKQAQKYVNGRIQMELRGCSLQTDFNFLCLRIFIIDTGKNINSYTQQVKKTNIKRIRKVFILYSKSLYNIKRAHSNLFFLNQEPYKINEKRH